MCTSVCLCVRVSSDSTATAAVLSAGIPQCLVSVTCIYRCLYDMALDMSDR